jgi:hypothetical protein
LTIYIVKYNIFFIEKPALIKINNVMDIAGRNVVHMDLDSFFVSVERLQNSSLEGKPILIGGTSDRGVVASCSYETRRTGYIRPCP